MPACHVTSDNKRYSQGNMYYRVATRLHVLLPKRKADIVLYEALPVDNPTDGQKENDQHFEHLSEQAKAQWTVFRNKLVNYM